MRSPRAEKRPRSNGSSRRCHSGALSGGSRARRKWRTRSSFSSRRRRRTSPAPRCPSTAVRRPGCRSFDGWRSRFDLSMKIASVEPIPVSVPYRHREVSSQVKRDGVSDVLVKVTTDDGLVGWGEACCGADTASVEAAVKAMAPFVLSRDPWNREAMRREAFTHGLWQFRAGTGNFAWAGIDMALWDICGRACGQPVWRLLGGRLQPDATYFYYLARGPRESLAVQVADGLAKGFEVYYLKVGVDDAAD